jgi:hypothetical protein
MNILMLNFLSRLRKNRPERIKKCCISNSVHSEESHLMCLQFFLGTFQKHISDQTAEQALMLFCEVLMGKPFVIFVPHFLLIDPLNLLKRYISLSKCMLQ